MRTSVSHVCLEKSSLASPDSTPITRQVPHAPDPPVSSNVNASATPSPVRSPRSTRTPKTPLPAGSVNAYTTRHTGSAPGDRAHTSNPVSGVENAAAARAHTNENVSATASTEATCERRGASDAARSSSAPTSGP
jgi:hypothetical protein